MKVVFFSFRCTVFLSRISMAGSFIGCVLVRRQSELLSDANEFAHRPDIGYFDCGKH